METNREKDLLSIWISTHSVSEVYIIKIILHISRFFLAGISSECAHQIFQKSSCSGACTCQFVQAME